MQAIQGSFLCSQKLVTDTFCALSILMLAFHLRLGLTRYIFLLVCSTGFFGNCSYLLKDKHPYILLVSVGLVCSKKDTNMKLLIVKYYYRLLSQ
jgi:hypothetical protein